MDTKLLVFCCCFYPSPAKPTCIALLTSQGLPWSQRFSWCHRHAFSKIHRWTRRFLSPFRAGLGGGEEEERERQRERGCRRITSRLTQPRKKKKRKVMHFSISPRASWLSVSTVYLASWALACSQANPKGVWGEVCPTPRGYFTNLFDVADPKPELPQCSDHCDGGNTGSPPPPTPGGIQSVFMRRCFEQRMTLGSRIRAAVPSSHTDRPVVVIAIGGVGGCCSRLSIWQRRQRFKCSHCSKSPARCKVLESSVSASVCAAKIDCHS